MKINEIILPPYRGDANRRLLAAGYSEIGDGSNGTVFQKPGSPYVLKTFSDDDDAYLAFVAMVKANPNPHFPKFKGKLIHVNNFYYAIRMEALTPVPDSDDSIDFIVFYIQSIDRDLNQYPNMKEKCEAAIKWMDDHPDMKHACDLIYGLLKSNPRFRSDLKIDNLMLRQNTIVFIDPIASR